MRVTPKISDMPTETRKRSIPTLRPLITCTVMSGPLVIQGKSEVMALLLLLGRGRPDLGDLVAAPDDVLAVRLLHVAQHRLALGVHLHGAHPLWWDGLHVAAAHDHLAPWEFHLVAFAQRRDDLVGLRALGSLDGFHDDVGAGVAPGGAQRRVLLRAVGVLLHPLGELGMTLLHALVVPGEARRDGADGRLLAEWLQLVGVAHRGADELDLVEQAERARLLDERDLLRAPHRADEGL